MSFSDVWLFKEGLAIRVVGLAIWPRDAEAMVRTLNQRRTPQQIVDGYEYIALERGETQP